MSGLKVADLVALVLIIVGGLNWLLFGLFEFDLVAALFGQLSVLSRIVYVVVGISAIYTIFRLGALVHPTHRPAAAA